ncbi:hypothetical protein CAEBREN_25157 [Caenorhabditis brenneri]|uniref:Serpentine receptor class r-10 n=1 Tax=Caenorhabditis brenneri TaxID=135651 RepID=G0P1B2_CAEBE|nr:hypothetical protein CAEBREN_25157 [Caenorhabditis brenneri]
MDIETFRLTKLFIQVISVILSLFVNTLLITLIVTKSPSNMGTYRHLMVYFSCCSMVFSILDVVVQPNIQTYKSAFFMVIDLKKRGMAPWFGKFCVYALCGCFGVTIYGIAIHFVYRFFALERRGKVRFFKGPFLIFWFLIPSLGGFAWYMVTALVFPKTKEVTEYIRSSVKDSFNMDIDDCAYNAGVFFTNDASGARIVNWMSWAGFACYLSIMAIPFTIIVIFGYKSWKIVDKLLEQGESDFSRNLQMQLYKALVAQTLIPILLLFMPFGLLFTLPIFEIDCQYLAALITLIFAIYPAVDPLPILYFVDFYRIPILEWFQRKCQKGNRVCVPVVHDGSITIEGQEMSSNKN